MALGARRLSIIDLAGGRQPIANEDGSVWVAFNGELFEYPELRRELLAGGHHLATRCDTEAWVHLYEDHGEGMFDQGPRPVRRLALGSQHAHAHPGPRPGRDLPPVLHPGRRLAALGLGDQGAPGLGTGRRPARSSRASITSSRSSARARPGPSSRGSNRSRRDIFSRFVTAGSPSTATGTSTFPTPAPNAGSTTRRRWSKSWRRCSQQAVERRLRSDVPVVSYISGGLDSTVVLGFCSRHRGEAIPAFTVGLDRAGPDERAACDRGRPSAGLAA